MREVKPTQKPVPSSDIKDLFFNSGLLDIWATSLEPKYIDRFGNCHLTAAGMEWIFNELVTKFKIESEQALLAAGYAPMGTFQEGAEVISRNGTVFWKLPDGDGDHYRWDGGLPKLVPAGSTPQSTGGIGKGAWVSVGDASLRGELNNKNYRTVSEMISSIKDFNLIAGDIIKAANYEYVVADQSVADAHVVTNSGLKLYVMPAQDGYYHINAFGTPTDGETDASAYFNRALKVGPVQCAGIQYVVNGLDLVAGMTLNGINRRSGKVTTLMCKTANGKMFKSDSTNGIHNIEINNIHADASEKGVEFFSVPVTNKYTGTVRMNEVTTTNNFRLLFRAIPIYWKLNDCTFGFDGHRFYGTQAFQVMYAWGTATDIPINKNQCVNCTFYWCSSGTDAGQQIAGAFEMRGGMSFIFDKCSAERMNVPIFKTYNVALLQWLNGWIEQIKADYMFDLDFDSSAPIQLNNAPFVLEGTLIQGVTENKAVIRNPTTYVVVKNISSVGEANSLPICTAPTLLYDASAIRGGLANSLPSMQINRQNISEYNLNHLSGLVPPQAAGIKLSYWSKLRASNWSISSTGSTPIKSDLASEVTNDTATLYTIGSDKQCMFYKVPNKQSQAMRGRRITLVITGYTTSAPTGIVDMITPKFWIDVTPSYDNYAESKTIKHYDGTTQAPQATTASIEIPTTAQSVYIGFVANGNGNGKSVFIETAHVLDGEMLITAPIYS